MAMTTMSEYIILIGLIVDLVGAILMYYGKIFRSAKTIEQMSQHSQHEIEHRIFETKLARIGAIFLIAGFAIQIIGYIVKY